MSRRDQEWPLDRPPWIQFLETGGIVFALAMTFIAAGYIAAKLASHEPAVTSASIEDRADADCYRRPRKITPACEGHSYRRVPE